MKIIESKTCKDCPSKNCSGNALRELGWEIIRCPADKDCIKREIKQLRLQLKGLEYSNRLKPCSPL